MKTLVDLFEVGAPLTSPRPLPAPQPALAQSFAPAFDGALALTIEEESGVVFDWEEDTFHGSGTTEDSGMFRGNRVWSSED